MRFGWLHSWLHIASNEICKRFNGGKLSNWKSAGTITSKLHGMKTLLWERENLSQLLLCLMPEISFNLVWRLLSQPTISSSKSDLHIEIFLVYNAVNGLVRNHLAGQWLAQSNAFWAWNSDAPGPSVTIPTHVSRWCSDEIVQKHHHFKSRMHCSKPATQPIPNKPNYISWHHVSPSQHTNYTSAHSSSTVLLFFTIGPVWSSLQSEVALAVFKISL